MTAALDALPAEFGAAGDDKDREAVVEKARGFTYELRQFHMALPWIESARRTGVSQGTILLFDEMAETILGTAADVVATPYESYMYAVRAKPFRTAFLSVKRPYPTVAPPLIVYYPAGEVESAFLHLVAAHEFGHGGVLERDLITAVETVHPDMGPVLAKLTDAANVMHSRTALDPTLAQAHTYRVFRNWLEEILCDALATSYLGPAFGLSFAAFLFQFSGSTPGESHPSTTFRTRLLLAQLDEMGWLPDLRAALPNIAAWLEDVAAQPMAASAGVYYAPVEEALELVGPTIRKVADLGDLAFTPERFENADELAELIEARVLPAQLLNGAPAHRRSVVYSGWLHALRVLSDHPASLAKATSDRSLQAFLTKALEMSAVLQKWGTV